MKKSKPCGKMVFKKGMSEPRPCMRKLHPGHRGGYVHYGHHTPDLTGMKKVFGYVEILKRAPDYITPGTAVRSSAWWVLDKFGEIRVIKSNSLFRGESRGRRFQPKSLVNKTKRFRKEYATVNMHWRYIHTFNSEARYHGSYKRMRFYDAWNPKKGGSLLIGAMWIDKNLRCPGLDYQMHVIKSKKHPYGYFGPGGIEWRPKIDRHDQHLLDHIYNMPKQNLIDLRQEIDRQLMLKAA